MTDTKYDKLLFPISNNSTIYAAHIIKPTDDDRYYQVTKVIKGNSLHNKLTRIDTSDNYLLRKGFAHVTVNPVIQTENTISYIESYIPLLHNGKTYCIIIQWLAPDTLLLQQKHSNEVTSLTQTVAIVIAVTFIVIACISLVQVYRTKSLIKELSHSIQSVAAGSLDIALNDSVDSELKDIAQSFNSLVENIKNKEQMLQTIKEETFTDIFKRGVAYLKEMKLDEACACFQVMLIYKPTSFASVFNLGVCYAKKGDFKTSLQYFMKAKELNPDNELTMRYIEKLQTFI